MTNELDVSSTGLAYQSMPHTDDKYNQGHASQ